MNLFNNILIHNNRRQIQHMLTKKQFLALYDETVLGIRQIKNNNDKINKSIGVLNDAALHRQTQAQKQMVENLFQKVQQLIQKMQKNYLDPDTARKIGVVKQQLRIQKDRRQQLLENVDQITQQFKNKQKLVATEEQLTQNHNHNPPKNKRTPAKNSKNPIIEMQSNDQYHHYNRSQITDIGDESTQGDHQKTQVNMQLSDYDLQIQRKLIHDKNQQLVHAHERMLNIKNIVNQTADLAYAQGDKIDIIGEDLFKVYKNVGMANNQLEQANQNQRKSRKKQIVLSLLLLIIIGVVLFLIFGM